MSASRDALQFWPRALAERYPVLRRLLRGLNELRFLELGVIIDTFSIQTALADSMDDAELQAAQNPHICRAASDREAVTVGNAADAALREGSWIR